MIWEKPGNASGPLPAVLKKTIFITQLADPKLHLKSPLPIYLEQVGEQVLAYCYDIEELALGSDEWQAVEEIKASIAELYWLLKSEQENLGPLQQKHWDILRVLVSEQ